MELNVYDIIKKPIITSRSVELFRKLGKITFEVHKDANKIVIKNAVEKIWNVKVASVCVMNVPGKVKSFARKEFETPGRKKAIVTLKKGYKIEIPGMLETIGATESFGTEDGSK
jgi:large subunit ribosomal protein L23